MQESILITVSGKVQGVFFRHSTKERALALGLKGKVMNLPSGHVQVIATGNREDLDALIAWCRTGPPKAFVSSVDVQPIPLQEFNHFTIARF